MKVFLLAVVVAVALGAGAALVLSRSQETAYEAFATSGARVGDPGHNLVGPNWTGKGG
jgi:hypothetical protein